MPGTAINQINYGSKANQQTSNDIDGILNEVQQIDKSAGVGTGQYNANGQSGPIVQVNPVPKQFQYDPTPPQQLPVQQMQATQMSSQGQMQMEQFQSGPMYPYQSQQSSSWEWMKSMKLTLVMLLLLTLFFNPFTISLWKKIPIIAERPMLAKLISGLLFCLSFYLISLFI